MRSFFPVLLTTTLLTTAALAQTATTPSAAVMQAAPAAQQGANFGLGKMFDEADTNRDNVVTREEFLAKADRHFGMGDTNKDGKITREEMQVQQNILMQQMQKNLFGNGGGWQGKLNEFMGSGAAPTTPVLTSPTAPVVPAPTAPTAPTSSY